jgi:hypothetical protein
MMDKLLYIREYFMVYYQGTCITDRTYVLERSPVHARSNGDNPIELQTAAATYRPIARWLVIVARSQHVPTIRAWAKTLRKKNPLLQYLLSASILIMISQSRSRPPRGHQTPKEIKHLSLALEGSVLSFFLLLECVRYLSVTYCLEI